MSASLHLPTRCAKPRYLASFLSSLASSYQTTLVCISYPHVRAGRLSCRKAGLVWDMSQDMRGPSQKIIEAMSKRNYDFHYLIHGGDINYSDGRDPVRLRVLHLPLLILCLLPSFFRLRFHNGLKVWEGVLSVRRI
jgi:hypothetical protein